MPLKAAFTNSISWITFGCAHVAAWHLPKCCHKKGLENYGALLFSSADTPSLAAQLLECQTDKKSDESKKDTSQVGLELVEYISAANSSKYM